MSRRSQRTCVPRPRTTAVRLGILPAAGAVAAATLLSGCSSPSGASRPGQVAYVATGANLAVPGNPVSVVDLATGKALPSIGTGSATTGTLPSAFAATPDGKDVLVALQGVDQVAEIDVASGVVVGKVAVGLEPDAVAITPDGALALVANLGDSTVTPVRLPSLRAGTPIPVGPRPVAIAVTPNGQEAVVAGNEAGTSAPSGTVTTIALPSRRPGATVDAGQEPSAVAVTPDGTTALVTDFQADEVTPIDLASGAAGPTVSLGTTNPTGIAIWPSGSVAYISGGDTVTPLSLASLHVGTPIPVGTTAQALALANGGHTAWVCGGNGALVSVDLATGAVTRSVHVGGQPSAVVVPTPLPSAGGHPTR